jgi:hypothetical protein
LFVIPEGDLLLPLPFLVVRLRSSREIRFRHHLPPHPTEKHQGEQEGHAYTGCGKPILCFSVGARAFSPAKISGLEGASVPGLLHLGYKSTFPQPDQACRKTTAPQGATTGEENQDIPKTLIVFDPSINQSFRSLILKFPPKTTCQAPKPTNPIFINNIPVAREFPSTRYN